MQLQGSLFPRLRIPKLSHSERRRAGGGGGRRRRERKRLRQVIGKKVLREKFSPSAQYALYEDSEDSKVLLPVNDTSDTSEKKQDI
ncbi:hypothetical protein STEG23_028777 [Scotinomys teguina]